MRQTSLIDTIWLQVKDGNDTGRSIFDNHYSRRHYRNGPRSLLYGGPGERMILITPDALALLIWRKFFSLDHQPGVSCACFRNEGSPAGKSSDLIRAGMEIAWERWPNEQRLYTYINTKQVRHKRDPGRCFLRAGWKHAGVTKGGLLILEVERL